VCCSHYGLRLIVVRTATLLMRRLLVWCERLSCSSELVVVMCILRVVEELWRAAVESLATDHEARAHRCGYVREMRGRGAPKRQARRSWLRSLMMSAELYKLVPAESQKS
jgi:hypothetical protein